jgi:hypothetical protein
MPGSAVHQQNHNRHLTGGVPQSKGCEPCIITLRNALSCTCLCHTCRRSDVCQGAVCNGYESTCPEQSYNLPNGTECL